jgi:hypothetical protein
MRIECPWSVNGFCKPISFSVDITLVGDAAKLIENRIRVWWPSVKIERHEDMDGNENIYFYENPEMFNECHTHGACLHTMNSVMNVRMVDGFARLIIWNMDGRPMVIVDDIIQLIRTKVSKPKEKQVQLDNLTS